MSGLPLPVAPEGTEQSPSDSPNQRKRCLRKPCHMAFQNCLNTPRDGELTLYGKAWSTAIQLKLKFLFSAAIPPHRTSTLGALWEPHRHVRSPGLPEPHSEIQITNFFLLQFLPSCLLSFIHSFTNSLTHLFFHFLGLRSREVPAHIT